MTEDKSTPVADDSRQAELSRELFHEHRQRNFRQTDRLFIVLMVLQWVGGIVTALVVSPRTWIGATPYVHAHAWAAFLVGGAISSAPIFMALRYPGTAATRHVIALAQAFWSALLIHLSGGRLETHFHVFGSLAFLAFYRDWRVLITASAVVAGDHFIRGIWWPASVYGVILESPYRWIEHAGWVVFEDVFLIFSCVRGVRETREIAERRAMLEITNAEIEDRVRQRTRQLENAREQLEVEFTEHRKTQQERERLYSELAAASRQAGMAEVATGVLHNVGNVLNSINVSVQVLMERARSNRSESLKRACGLIEANRSRLDEFLVHDERGRRLPGYLSHLAETMASESDESHEEIVNLAQHVEHIKRIVVMQQGVARKGCLREPVDLAQITDDALKINAGSLSRHGVSVERQFAAVPPVVTDKHRVMQILVNLVKNAIEAVGSREKDDRGIVVRILQADEATAVVCVSDNGIGISAENLSGIFTHGFTTKDEGHGFGLHSGALAANEIGGNLRVHSDGEGLGATFTLELPIDAKSGWRDSESATTESIV